MKILFRRWMFGVDLRRLWIYVSGFFPKYVPPGFLYDVGVKGMYITPSYTVWALQYGFSRFAYNRYVCILSRLTATKFVYILGYTAVWMKGFSSELFLSNCPNVTTSWMVLMVELICWKHWKQCWAGLPGSWCHKYQTFWLRRCSKFTM